MYVDNKRIKTLPQCYKQKYIESLFKVMQLLFIFLEQIEDKIIIFQGWHHITLEAEIERAMLLALKIKGLIHINFVNFKLILKKSLDYS